MRVAAVTALLVAAAAATDAISVNFEVLRGDTGNGNAPRPNRRAVNGPDASTLGSTAGSVDSASASASGSSDAAVQPTKKPAVSVSKDGVVTSILARVQGDAPAWDAENKAFVSTFGDDFAAKYLSTMDTVNLASVEGALMYVQAEGINESERGERCERKNKMKYVVFYEIQNKQPVDAVAFYNKGPGDATPAGYCPFVAMDGGKCTPEGDDIPDACKSFVGLDDVPKRGFCVGAGDRSTDPRAPYPGNYWYSFPNSCPTKTWKEKKDAQCRKEQAGGLCAFGQRPDGESCTFAYKILGYLALDDLVGITDGTAVGEAYEDFAAFCEAGNVEFKAKNTGKGFQVEQSIPFWENPSDEERNAERAQTLVEKYNEAAAKSRGQMTPLPTVEALAASNPPCYETTAKCEGGCQRAYLSQICVKCESKENCAAGKSTLPRPTKATTKASNATSDDASASASESGSASVAEVTEEPTEEPVDETEAPETEAPVTPTPAPTSATTLTLTSLAAVAVSALASALM